MPHPETGYGYDIKTDCIPLIPRSSKKVLGCACDPASGLCRDGFKALFKSRAVLNLDKDQCFSLADNKIDLADGRLVTPA